MDRAEQAEKTIKKIMGLIEKFSMEEMQELHFDLEGKIVVKRNSQHRKRANH